MPHFFRSHYVDDTCTIFIYIHCVPLTLYHHTSTSGRNPYPSDDVTSNNPEWVMTSDVTRLLPLNPCRRETSHWTSAKTRTSAPTCSDPVSSSTAPTCLDPVLSSTAPTCSDPVSSSAALAATSQTSIPCWQAPTSPTQALQGAA